MYLYFIGLILLIICIDNNLQNKKNKTNLNAENGNDSVKALTEEQKKAKKDYAIINTAITILIFGILFIIYWILTQEYIYFIAHNYLISSLAIIFTIFIIIMPFILTILINRKYINKLYNENNYLKVKKIAKVIMVICYIVLTLLILYILIILPIMSIGETSCFLSNCHTETFLTGFYKGILLLYIIFPIIGIIMIVNAINSIIVNKNFERYNSNKNDISFKNNTEDLL